MCSRRINRDSKERKKERKKEGNRSKLKVRKRERERNLKAIFTQAKHILHTPPSPRHYFARLGERKEKEKICKKVSKVKFVNREKNLTREQYLFLFTLLTPSRIFPGFSLLNTILHRFLFLHFETEKKCFEIKM